MGRSSRQLLPPVLAALLHKNDQQTRINNTVWICNNKLSILKFSDSLFQFRQLLAISARRRGHAEAISIATCMVHVQLVETKFWGP